MKYSTGLAVSLGVLLTGFFTWGVSTDPEGVEGLIKSGPRQEGGAIPLALLEADRKSDALTYKAVADAVAQPALFSFPPPEDETLSPDFLSFLETFRDAALDGNWEEVFAATDAEISWSFGDDVGIEGFKAHLNNEDYGEEVKAAFVDTLMLPAGRADYETDTDTHCLPYYWCMDLPEEAGIIDPFETVFILGNEVPLYDAPNGEGEEIMRVSWTAARSTDDYETPGWIRLELEGGTSAWVAAENARHLLDYRAVFDKIDGRWVMTVFIAGD